MVFRAISMFLVCIQVSQAATTDRLRIIGRGVENRKTGEVIALACVGEINPTTQQPSCGKLQAVKFKPDASAPELIIDRIFDLDQALQLKGAEPTTEHLEKYVRMINRWAKEFRRDVTQGRRGKIIATATLIGLGAVGGYFIYEDLRLKNTYPDDPNAGVKTGTFLLSWFGAMAVFIGISALVSNPVFPKSGVISEVMADQSGWNWSVSPKKVTNKAFGYFEAYFRDACMH